MAPENKVTPELAALKGSGLHPLVVFVDEIQELFLFGKTGKAAGEIAEKCIKLFRALGIILDPRARRSPTRTACRPGSPATSTPGSACRWPTRSPTT